MKIKETNKNKNNLLGGELDNMENKLTEGPITSAIKKKISRRTFIKAAAVAGGAVAVSGALNFASAAGNYGERSPDTLSGAGVAYKRSGCWGCAFGCGNQVRVVNGIASKIDGNPYDLVTNDLSPAGSEVETTDVADPVASPGRLCPKGQSMIKELYDPYRVLTPLKRAGKRGENKWTAISWTTAIEEITNGGSLVSPSGSGTYTFDGLKQIKGAGTAMGAHADIHSEFSGNAAVEALGLGQRIIWTDGRNQQGTNGRFLNRLGATGYDHSSVCNGSWKAAWSKTLGTYVHRPDLQSDLGTGKNADYIIYVGANPFEAEQALNYTGRKLTDRLADGAKLIIIDPRLSNTASKANTWGNGSKWVRIKQGGDGVFAMAMIKYWLASGRIDGNYAHLKATKTTATKLNYTNSAYLVEVPTASYPYGKISTKVVDDNGAGTGLTVEGLTGTTNGLGMLDPVGQSGGGAGKYDSDLYSGTVYQILKARVEALSQATIESTTGLTYNGDGTGDVDSIAKDFWDASRPVAFSYRGVQQTSNGYYNSQSWVMLNVLRDRVDRPGGLARQDNGYGLSSVSENGTNNAVGGSSSIKYDGASAVPTGFAGTPTRAWFPAATNGSQQEIFPREAIGYPWRIKAHIMYIHNPVFTHPAGKSDVAEAMKKIDSGDSTKYNVPLYVNITTSMNETAELCDYVLPASTWGERWTTPGSAYGGPLAQRGALRRPIVGSYEAVTIKDSDGSNSRNTYWYVSPFSSITSSSSYDGVSGLAGKISGPQTMEDILILMGRRLRELGDTDFAAYGYQGISATENYDSSYDHYRKALNGSAILHSGTVKHINSGADPEELKTILDAVDSGGALDTEAKQHIYMGGRRKNANPSYNSGGGYNANLYADAGLEYVANRHSQTNKKVWIDSFESKKRNYIDGNYVNQLPPADSNQANMVVSVDGTNLNNSDNTAGYKYTVTQNKLAFHAQSRTSQNEWLRELMPTNYVHVAAGSTDSAGTTLIDGDKVEIESNFTENTDGTGSKVKVTGEIRTNDTLASNVAYIPHHFGRWAAGANSFTVGSSTSTNGLTTSATEDDEGNFSGGTRGANFDNTKITHEGASVGILAAGTAVSPVTRRDTNNNDFGGGSVTDIGGSPVMYGFRVKITKV